MIENASSMDRPLAAPGGLTRPRVIAAAIIGAALIAVVLAFPAIRRWSRADRVVDATTLAIGTVTRGDLVRDVSVQGRGAAARHPTPVSPGEGSATVRTKPGTVGGKGAALAIVRSPELRSR